MKMNEEQIEALSELVELSGWRVLTDALLQEYVAMRSSMLSSCLVGSSAGKPENVANASYELGRRHGALDILSAAYSAANATTPESLKVLRRLL